MMSMSLAEVAAVRHTIQYILRCSTETLGSELRIWLLKICNCLPLPPDDP